MTTTTKYCPIIPLTKTPSLPLSPLTSLPSLPSPYTLTFDNNNNNNNNNNNDDNNIINTTTTTNFIPSTVATTEKFSHNSNDRNDPSKNNRLVQKKRVLDQDQEQEQQLFFKKKINNSFSTTSTISTTTTNTTTTPISILTPTSISIPTTNSATISESMQIKKKRFVIIRPRFSDYYITENRIGSGTFAVVKKCRRKNAINQAFAVKIIEKKNLTSQELMGLKLEIKILQNMEHASIIKVIDVFEDARKVKIVLELCEGGDLFDQMLKIPQKRLEEPKAAWITCKIAKALHYLHEHYVVHRDLKPENILFMQDGQIKITDFGLAHYLKLPPNLHSMHTCCGTPHYVAPEVLGSDEYSVQVDFWSLGVILYVMLSGYQPFNSKSIRTMYGMITRGQYRFSKPHWDHVSAEAKSCVKGLMNVDPEKRLNYITLCQHPFILKNVDLDMLEKEEKESLHKQRALVQTLSSLLVPSSSSNVFSLPEGLPKFNECNKLDNVCAKEEQKSSHLLPQTTHGQESRSIAEPLAFSSYPSNYNTQVSSSHTIAAHVEKRTSAVMRTEAD